MKQVASNPQDKDGEGMGFTLLRVPFFLEPDYPTDPSFEETNRVRLVRKWGGKEGWERQKANHGLKERGQEVGIEHFNLDRIASNTLASHRVVQWITRTKGINEAEQLYNSLNKCHFEDGKKLNDEEMLVQAAASVGADPEETRRVIQTGEGSAQIQAAQEQLRTLGVSGIPTLILGGKYMMPSGAIGAEHLVDAFRQLEVQGGATGSMFAEPLGIPDEIMEQTLTL